MHRSIRAAGTVALLAALTACSSEEESINALDVLGELREVISQGDGAQPLEQSQIDQAVAQIPSPLKFIEVTSRGGQAVFAPIQENGPYVTYASSTGQSVVFRNGFAVQSRGFGGDLMSSDEDALLRLVRARSGGTAPYVMRFLSGDNDTIVHRYTCNVIPQGPTPYAAGVVRSSATELEVHCVSEGGTDFVSSFTVDGSGEVLAARHWFGRLSEDLVYLTLRQ
ncbi:hypothetical protein OCH239_06625 [Roseivivax halodurans JCM 10272]|uniref:Group 4 capsule polysaccharide lipoprotein gfcB, YjbF n=1 Tax=Roseivivax halodurans JCM 10272 TaxID=1449350 RepID=X7ECQ7_9RHOB|nr:YjbF family lipoprotein [Roseivivax halodurans]ETX13864.1 hypothetical protein OCH239_06625 [Roseivivax halodurans JCM 10272]